MKRIIVLLLTACMLVSLVGCGESAPKCEHANTTTTYEISGLSIKKRVICNDCEKEVSNSSLTKISYVYDKVLVDDKGIKCTLLNIEVDGWSTVTINFEIEGTSEKKRTFEIDKMYVNGYEESAWIYVSDLSGNRKSKESEWLTSIKGEDFLKSQDLEVEFVYHVMDSSSYKNLLEKELKINLSEYVRIDEAE